MKEVLVVLGVILLAHLLDRAWPRSNAAKFRRAYGEWSRECDARGLSAEEKVDEFQLRHSLVRMRRRVSDASVSDPLNWRDHLAEISVEEGKALAAYDKKLARQFLKTVRDSPPSDILYHDAMEAVLASRPIMPDTHSEPDDDDVAAVTTIKS